MLETSVRLLRLLALLQARPSWSGAELAHRMAVTSRTVRNDIERLRLLGYQVHSTTGTAGGYRLGAGGTLPPLLLDDEEAIAVAVSLHAAAGGTVTGIEETSLRALTKLHQMLPSRLRRRLDAVEAAVLSVPGRGPTLDAETLTAIAAAIRDHERLRFDYRSPDATVTHRIAEPHHLVNTGRRWYLLAWDNDRNDWRTFRADRITLRTPNGPRFTPRAVPGGDAVAHVLRGTGGAPGRYSARIRLHAPIGVVGEEIPPGAGVLHAVDEHSCVLETGPNTLANLASFLGDLETAFMIIDPPELRAYLKTLVARFQSSLVE